MKHAVWIPRLTISAGLAILLGIGSCGALLLSTTTGATDLPRVEENGTVHVPAFALPESAFLSAETRATLKQARDAAKNQRSEADACPPIEGAKRADIPNIRQCQADAFYKAEGYQSLRDHRVVLTPQEIGGVYTEVFTPESGISPRNKQRVLLNVHGGGFEGGSRWISHLESIPIASIGKIKVISIDYRLGPEYTFPAASEDVAAVYRKLLKTYKAGNIGLFGCSAGAWLTAQSIAWFQKEHLALPGAIGMFCEGAPHALDSSKDKWLRSDSAYIVGALLGQNYEQIDEHVSYYSGVNLQSPLVSPGGWDAPVLHDSLTLAFLLQPALCPVKPMRIRIDDKGVTRVEAGQPNANVCLHPDADAFLKLHMHRLLDL